MKRLLPTLCFLLWSAAASAQIATPGGGTNIIQGGGVTGGNCAPQFVQGMDTSGNLTCATPAGGGGGAALVNPAGGQNNYAPIDSPVFTTLVTTPDLVVTGTSINGLYFKVGANIQSQLFTTASYDAYWSAGSHFTGSQWVADATGATIIGQQAAQITIWQNSGLTPGNPYAANIITTIGPGGINLPTGENFSINGVPIGGGLATPVSIANGGLGQSTAPSAGMIDIAQSATVISPKALSGDATITSAGAITVTKTNGTSFTGLATATIPLSIANGGTGSSTAPSSGQILVASSATVLAPSTMSGDASIVSGGAVKVTALHFSAAAVALPAVAPTSGGIPYFSSTSAIASSALLTANMPVIGGGAGVAPAVGTVSGNTTKFVTTTGTLTSGDVAAWDASGNAVDGGAAPAITSGSWTPALASSGATFTYTTQTGTYYQVGKLMWISFGITLASATGTSGNNTVINGLPCTSADNQGGYLGIPIIGVTGVASQIMAYTLSSGGNYVNLKMIAIGASVFVNPFASNQLTSTAQFQGGFVYKCT